MAVLYVAENGSKVHKEDERVVVRLREKVLEEIPLIKLEKVVVMGRGVQITTQAMFALVNKGVDVIYLKGGGGFGFRVLGKEHNLSQLRYRQAHAIDDPDLTLRVAREVVRAKVLNQRVLVQRHAERAGWARRALQTMAQMAGRVDEARTLDELRGFEGNAARAYFDLFRRLLRDRMGFERRAYYPPTDPVNALLSFGYTLLLNDCVSACQIAGLDPYLGFFHTIEYGRPSMALDLEEAMRPVIVDSLVLGLLNGGRLKAGDFQAAKRRQPAGGPVDASHKTEQRPTQRGIYLKEDARHLFVEAYELRINTTVQYPQGESDLMQQTSYRRTLLLQAQSMARVILGEAEKFTPLRTR